MHRLLRFEVYTAVFLMLLSLSAGIAAAANLETGPPRPKAVAAGSSTCYSCLGQEKNAGSLVIEGPAHLAKGQAIELTAIMNGHRAENPVWILSDPDGRARVEKLGTAVTVLGVSASTQPNDIEITATIEVDGSTVKAVHSLTVVEVRLTPDADQAGLTGDMVPSVLDDNATAAAEGTRHFVSPKRQGEFVTFRAQMNPPGIAFEDVFRWRGGKPVANYRGKRKVGRDQPAVVDVEIATKDGLAILDRVRVWIVFAKIERTGLEPAVLADALVNGGTDELQNGKLVTSSWRFSATIQPAAIVSPAPEADIPDLRGKRTAPVPEAGARHVTSGVRLGHGAETKWDMSRQMRIKAYSPGLETEDYDGSAGGSMYASIGSQDDLITGYPRREAEANDDTGTGDEDNDPYSSEEIRPGTRGKTPGGMLASADRPKAPVWIRGSSKSGDRLEWRIHFREFVRVQIGPRWYRISSYSEGEWQHVAKAVRTAHDWVDAGSRSSVGNAGFAAPF